MHVSLVTSAGTYQEDVGDIAVIFKDQSIAAYIIDIQ